MAAHEKGEKKEREGEILEKGKRKKKLAIAPQVRIHVVPASWIGPFQTCSGVCEPWHRSMPIPAVTLYTIQPLPRGIGLRHHPVCFIFGLYFLYVLGSYMQNPRRYRSPIKPAGFVRAQPIIKIGLQRKALPIANVDAIRSVFGKTNENHAIVKTIRPAPMADKYVKLAMRGGKQCQALRC